MRSLIKLSGYSLFYFAVLISFNSCNSSTDKEKATESSVSNDSTTVPEKGKEQPTSTSISGTLDQLWVLKTDFNKLPNQKLVFSFVFRTNDTLTLYGWSCNGSSANCNGTYQNDPNIKLIKGQSTGIKYGPIVNFGNIILQRRSLRNIQDNFTTYKYVVFVPSIADGFITYKIFVTNDDPSIMEKVLMMIPTNDDANPSPPRGYN